MQVNGTPMTGAQLWAQHQYQPHFHTPIANQQQSLNPSVTSFQPTGMEMQRFQQNGMPTPPSSNAATPTEMMQMQRFVLGNHFDHTKEVASLERRTKRIDEEVDVVKDVVTRDMRILQDQITDLKQQVAAQRQHDDMLTRTSRADQVARLPEDFTENFSKETIADAYLEEADDYEKAAAKLREQAEDICNGGTARKLVTLKLLDHAADDTAGANITAEFACCGNVFAGIDDMLEHVGSAHGFHGETNEHPIAATEGLGDETPTHVPARRVKAEKEDHALKTKVPQEDGEQTRSAAEDSKADNGMQTSAKAKSWIPFAVRQMPSPVSVAAENIETFPWEFLIRELGGEQWSPGFYFISKNSCLKSQAYWILEGDYEPYLPSAAGEHGAKLTAFFNGTESRLGEAPTEENYEDCPVFIRAKGGKEYRYFGNYSQLRFSDKLDYDHLMAEVPEHVRNYWAEQLAAEGRPEWVTQALMDHFWPKPTYCGPIPTDSAINTPATEATAKTASGYGEGLERRVVRALNEYADELKDWQKEVVMKAHHLTKEHLMEAFTKADADEDPGLRLWFEYLQCVKYDQEFYDFLVKLKYNKGLQKAAAGMSKGQKALVNGRVGGGKVVKPVNGVETVKPTAAAAPKLSQHTSTATTAYSGKPHSAGVQPWKEPKEVLETNLDGSNKPNGDLQLAKQMQQTFTKAKPGKPRGDGGTSGSGQKAGNGYVPPHQRKK
ncbi:hypothetical protein LTR37_017197 [Vermiconidia calcicola]|uniref:Uncharacterized protein n=1 Tax=Vermiconidia calcicola TaxID=1690605 RepID=A0ACC3MKT9_9PEZI|nr:hypothetical protein LTR37_017197 [Vermiconidia calcicola]